jgi:hypothetical protein
METGKTVFISTGKTIFISPVSKCMLICLVLLYSTCVNLLATIVYWMYALYVVCAIHLHSSLFHSLLHFYSGFSGYTNEHKTNKHKNTNILSNILYTVAAHGQLTSFKLLGECPCVATGAYNTTVCI